MLFLNWDFRNETHPRMEPIFAYDTLQHFIPHLVFKEIGREYNVSE